MENCSTRKLYDLFESLREQVADGVYMEMRTFRRLFGELKWICDTSLCVSIAKLWNYLMLFASSASVLLIVYSRMQQNNARRLCTT